MSRQDDWEKGIADMAQKVQQGRGFFQIHSPLMGSGTS